jgi:hypothetical protein
MNNYQNYGFDIGAFNTVLRFFRSHEAQHDINELLGLIFVLGLDMLIDDLLKKVIKDLTNIPPVRRYEGLEYIESIIYFPYIPYLIGIVIFHIYGVS